MHTCPMFLDVLLLLTLHILQSQQDISREAEIFGDPLLEASNAPSWPRGNIPPYSSNSLQVEIPDDHQFANSPWLTRSTLTPDYCGPQPLSQRPSVAGASRDHNSGQSSFPSRRGTEIFVNRAGHRSGQHCHGIQATETDLPHSSSQPDLKTGGINLALERVGLSEMSRFPSLSNLQAIRPFQDGYECMESAGLSSSPIDWFMIPTDHGDVDDVLENDTLYKVGDPWKLGSMGTRSGYLATSTKPDSGLNFGNLQTHPYEIPAAAPYLPIHLRSESASICDFSGMDCLSEVFESGMPHFMKVRTSPSGKESCKKLANSARIWNSFSNSVQASQIRPKLTNIPNGIETAVSVDTSNEILKTGNAASKSHRNRLATATSPLLAGSPGFEQLNEVLTSHETFQPSFIIEKGVHENRNPETQPKSKCNNDMIEEEKKKKEFAHDFKGMRQPFYSLVNILHREVGSQKELDMIAQEIGLSIGGIERSRDNIDGELLISNPTINQMKFVKERKNDVPLSYSERANAKLRAQSSNSLQFREKSQSIPFMAGQKPTDPSNFKKQNEAEGEKKDYNRSASVCDSTQMAEIFPETPCEQKKIQLQVNEPPGKKGNPFCGTPSSIGRKCFHDDLSPVRPANFEDNSTFKDSENLGTKGSEGKLGFITKQVINPTDSSMSQEILPQSLLSCGREKSEPHQKESARSRKDETISNFIIEMEGKLDPPTCKQNNDSYKTQKERKSLESASYRYPDDAKSKDMALPNDETGPDPVSEGKNSFAIADLVKTRARKNLNSECLIESREIEVGYTSADISSDQIGKSGLFNSKPDAMVVKSKTKEKKRNRKEVCLHDIYQRSKATKSRNLYV